MAHEIVLAPEAVEDFETLSARWRANGRDIQRLLEGARGSDYHRNPECLQRYCGQIVAGEALNFVINYDIKDRLGHDAAGEEGEE